MSATPVHHKFGSIDHFKDFLREVKNFYKNTPEERKPNQIRLRGTVKLHGTHADYVSEKNEDGTIELYCQSRNRVLSASSDNAGFAQFMDNIAIDKKLQLLSSIEAVYSANGEKAGPMKTLVVAGEFCGGNIQKHIALTQLPKMFVIFGIKINGFIQYFPDYYHIKAEEENIYNISKGKIFSTTFSLDAPELVVPILKDITVAVEKECPFAESFGVFGIGEGVVWTADNLPCSSRYCFKVKGELHTGSKVKTLDKRTKAELDLLKDVKTFAKNAVLEPRLLQGYDYLREMNLDTSMKNIGAYCK